VPSAASGVSHATTSSATENAPRTAGPYNRPTNAAATRPAKARTANPTTVRPSSGFAPLVERNL